VAGLSKIALKRPLTIAQAEGLLVQKKRARIPASWIATRTTMFESTFSGAQFILFVLICVALIATVIALIRARAEFVRLQNEVKQLRQSVKALEATEQRRFIVELKSKGAGEEPTIAASSTKVSAIPESGRHQSTAA
jgi:hypothetical protein